MGSVELVVLGLIAALIVALAIPMFFGSPKPVDQSAEQPPTEVNSLTTKR